ncbi:MAG TPA: PilZ domain-containing protein [Bryobacteraceae bacterium]|nr:PilZ domain-containing protein [Bryobacteraceae bacterium]
MTAANECRYTPGTERRTSPRFPIEQPVSYRILDAQPGQSTYKGVTLDMSSAGVLFTTDQQLERGKRLELCVYWPVALDSGCPLKLVAVGRVVRAEDGRAAMRIEKYEFRTRGSSRLPEEVAAAIGQGARSAGTEIRR